MHPPIYLGRVDLHTLSFFPFPTPLTLFLSLAMLTNTLLLPTRQGGPHGQTESGGRVLAVNAGARAPRGGVTRQGVVRTDLQSLLDFQLNSLSSPPLPPPYKTTPGLAKGRSSSALAAHTLLACVR